MKAGFLNVPVDDSTKELLGVVTQDGLYRYTRLAFGLIEAPMFFQYIMEELINTDQPPLQCEPYLDDLTCHGNDL